MEASESTTPEAPAPEGAPAEGQTPPAPDISEGLSTLNERLGAIEERLPAKEEQPSQDFIDSLLGIGGEDYGAEETNGQAQLQAQPQGQPQVDPYTGQPAQQPGQQPTPDEEAQAAEMLRQVIGEEVRGLVEPYFTQQEADKRHEALVGLTKKYPELDTEEVRTKLAERLNPLIQRYGRDVVTDPDVILNLYKSIKADAEAAGETTPEGVEPGATLETGAGASGAGEEQSPEEIIGNAILGVRSGSDRFT